MSWAALTRDGISIAESSFESARFDCSVSRLVVGQRRERRLDDELVVTRQLQESTDDLVICRWPGERAEFASAAIRSSRVLLPADMLVYWEAPVADFDPAGLLGDSSVSFHRAASATRDTADLLERIISDSFAGYGNHYAANPCLDDGLALQGYVEWAQRAFDESPENVMLMHDGDQPIGIATLSRDGDDLEIELAGLVAQHQGKGLYGALLAAIRGHAMNSGCSRVIISTQAHNVRVQRAWVRAGFKPFATVATVHAMTREFWLRRGSAELATGS